MNLRVDLIDEFCKIQNMSGEDRELQIKCIAEEFVELINDPNSVDECVDLLITVLVYARIAGFQWTELKNEFEMKMLENLQKPVRNTKGRKVEK